MGHPEELEVVVAIDQLVDRRQHLVEPDRLLDGAQVEGGLAAEGDGRDDAQGAQPHPGCGEDLGLLVRRAGDDRPVGRDQLETDHVGGQAAEPDARSVGAGRDGSGDRLVPDVSQVGQGQAAPSQLAGQGRQGHPRLDGDRRRIGVVAQHPGVIVQAHLHPVGARHVGEGVARAHRLHPEPFGCPGLHHLHQILDRAGLGDLDRGAPLVPAPVPPRTRGSVGHGEMLSSASRRRPGDQGLSRTPNWLWIEPMAQSARRSEPGPGQVDAVGLPHLLLAARGDRADRRSTCHRCRRRRARSPGTTRRCARRPGSRRCGSPAASDRRTRPRA